jgi:hypothetical protein
LIKALTHRRAIRKISNAKRFGKEDVFTKWFNMIKVALPLAQQANKSTKVICVGNGWYIGFTNLDKIQSFIQVGVGKQLANEDKSSAGWL